jgi:hypothetical protein
MDGFRGFIVLDDRQSGELRGVALWSVTCTVAVKT